MRRVWDVKLLQREWIPHTPKDWRTLENDVVVPERMVAIDHPKTDRLVSTMLTKYSLLLPLLKPSCRVLDACAGAGFGASLLASSGYEVTALDQRLPWASQREGVKCAEMDLFEFNDAPFDAITMIDAIEHFKDHQQKPALQHLYSLLKPGGWFVIDTPRVKESCFQSWCHPSCLDWNDFFTLFQAMGAWEEYQRYLIMFYHPKHGYRGFPVLYRFGEGIEPVFSREQDQVIIGRKPQK